MKENEFQMTWADCIPRMALMPAVASQTSFAIETKRDVLNDSLSDVEKRSRYNVRLAGLIDTLEASAAILREELAGEKAFYETGV